MTPVSAISQQIWDMKYRLKAADGAPIDKTIEDTWRRIANAAAAPEADAAGWAERFYTALDGFKFLPAGRIVAGAGTARNVTLFNCFVMGTIPDDMGGIFAHLREAGLPASLVGAPNKRDEVRIVRNAKPVFVAPRVKLQQAWSEVS